MAEADGYLLDNAATAAGERHRALAALYDEWTVAHLLRLGLAPGWRCWEVGAGGPELVRRLGRVVGDGGAVVATDVDPSWVEDAASGVVEVRRHDVGTEPPPGHDFDLVHARLVLVHGPRRHDALVSMASSLRPGGWLVVEDADPGLQPLACIDPTTEEDALANRLRAAFRTLMAGRGVDLAYGRTLARRLRDIGLEDVGAEALTVVAQPACAVLERTTMAVVRAALVDAGLATDAEIDRHLDAVDGSLVQLSQPPLVTAWGRAALR